MHTLNTVIKFIELYGMSIPDFELKAHLVKGTINKHKYEQKELSGRDVSKIISRFGGELVDTGFYITSLKFWQEGNKRYSICESDLTYLFFGGRDQ
ncbi:hypothetical protein [Foetidibacter luteolus]|uniref:hypothetical protein n=1 Tax=Foetidibacter luteolus TaxID=2608880 RepID=UPI00129A7505|nr:hypothetical protein [Foetidibacter luteolus]